MTFFKTNLITLFSKIVCFACTLFISIYIARFIGPSAKGIYYLLMQIVSILGTISIFGVDRAAVYYLGKGYSAKKVVFITNFFTIFITLIVMSCFLLAIKTQILKNMLSSINYRYLIIIAIAIPFMNLTRLNSAIIMGFNRYVAFNILKIALFVAWAVFFVIFVIIAKLSLFGALISFASAYLIMSLIHIIVVFGSDKIRELSNKKINSTTLLGYGTKVFLVPILVLLIYRIDLFFLGYYIDMRAVGFYSVALSFTELLLFIPESIGTILFPKLSYTEKENVDKKFIFILRISLILTATTACIFFIVIRYLLPFVYGDLYLQSVKLTYILLPGLFAMSSYYFFSSYFLAIGKPGFVSIILSIILIEKTLLCYLLIPRLSSVGAAIATAVSYSTCFIVFLLVFRTRTKFKMKEIFILQQSDINIIRNSLNNIFDFQK